MQDSNLFKDRNINQYMKIESKFCYYDPAIDDLLISNRDENEKVKRNFMFDDFIFSLTGSGKIIGLEIRNASRLLTLYGLDPKILEDNKGIELLIIPRGQFVYIGLLFKVVEGNRIVNRSLGITHLPMEVASQTL